MVKLCVVIQECFFLLCPSVSLRFWDPLIFRQLSWVQLFFIVTDQDCEISVIILIFSTIQPFSHKYMKNGCCFVLTSEPKTRETVRKDSLKAHLSNWPPCVPIHLCTSGTCQHGLLTPPWASFRAIKAFSDTSLWSASNHMQRKCTTILSILTHTLHNYRPTAFADDVFFYSFL